MKKLIRFFASLLTVLILLSFLADSTEAALKAAGPINPTTTVPTWYQDTNNLALEPCLDQNGFCILTPLFDPAVTSPPNPITTTGPINDANFPDESFYFLADSIITTPSGVKLVYRAALETAFLTGVAPNTAITFLRINMKKASGLTPNSTYTVTHPFGSFDVSTDNLGDLIVTNAGQAYRTEDPTGPAVGVYFPPDLAGATTTHIGPFLRTASGLVVDPISGNTYIGDAATPVPVTGGNNGNVFRVDGPNVGGPGVNSIQTNLFTLAGKVFTGPIASPTTIDRSTYAFDGINGQLDLFVRALPNAELTLTGTGIPRTTLTKDSTDPSKFFTTIPFTSSVPSNLNLENSLDTPTPTSIPHAVVLTDEVNITQATYNPDTQELTIKARSRDTVATLPVLSVRALANPNTLDGTGTLVKVLTSIPPLTVTVDSSKSGAATSVVSIVVPVPPLTITTASTLTSYTMGSPTDFYTKIDNTGGVAPYTWSVVGGTIPPGIAFFPATGELYGASGNITTPGTYSFILQVADGTTATALKAFTLAVTPAALTITASSPLPAYTVGGATDFYTKIATTGGAAPFIWTVTSGAIPPGIALFPSTGELYGATGNIATPGTYNFTLQVSDRFATTTSKAFTLVIAPAAVAITTASPLPAYTMGGPTDFYTKIATTGGTAPFTWAITAGAMPPGIAFFPATGELYGASGNITTPGTYNFTLRVTDAAAVTASKAFSLTISAAPLVITTTSPLSTFTIGNPTDFYTKIATTGGAAPLTWAITAGAMPPGIAFFPATGELYGASGNITTTGTYNFTLQVTDNVGTSASRAFSLNIQ